MNIITIIINCHYYHYYEALALGPNLNSFDEPRLLASVPVAHARALEAEEASGGTTCLTLLV